MRFRRFAFFAHKEGSCGFDGFNEVIGTIGFFTGIISSSEIFCKERLAVFFFGSENNSLIDESLLDTVIRIISIRTLSHMSRFSDISKMFRPRSSGSFKRRAVRESSQ